jgi:hypothetical protein
MPPTERSAGTCARAAGCCSTVRPGGPRSPSGQCHGADGRYREEPEGRAVTRTSPPLSPARIRCPRCSRRGCFVCFLLRGGHVICTVSPPRPGANPLGAAVFRTKQLLRERCTATCPRRRRPGQVRHRQGGLQITADMGKNLVVVAVLLAASEKVICARRRRSRR